MAPTRRTQEERRAATRAALVTAAAESFGRDGWAATSLDAVAAAAGLTKGAVYSNFGGKVDLFFAVVDEQNAGLLATVTGALEHATAGTLDEVLLQVADGLGEVLVPRDETVLIAQEARGLAVHDADAREHLARSQQLMLAAIAAAIDRVVELTGADLLISPTSLAAMLLAASQGLADLALVDPDAKHRELIALIPNVIGAFLVEAG